MLSPLVYCGPMWGGKTEGLITRLVRARIQKVNALAFNPKSNTRSDVNELRSHSGATFPALAVESASEILERADEADVFGIDEIFMIPGIAACVRELKTRGKKIVIATLDMDSDGKVWESVGDVLGMAEEIVKCPAVCSACKKDAYYSYRLPEAPQQRVLVGAANYYEPRCFACWHEGQAAKLRMKGQKALFRTTPELP